MRERVRERERDKERGRFYNKFSDFSEEPARK